MSEFQSPKFKKEIRHWRLDIGFIIPFFSFLSLNPLSAITVPELQEKMEQASLKVEGLSFHYLQEMRSELNSTVRHSSGTAVLLKPRHFRLEQTQPEPQTVVSSGKTVFIYTPRFRQAVKNSWNKWLSENLLFPGLATFSDAMKKLKGDYEWSILEEREMNGEKTICVRLNSRSAQQHHHLILCLGAADFIPRKTEWVSGTLSLSTTILSLEINPALSYELFRFRPPKGTAVVELK